MRYVFLLGVVLAGCTLSQRNLQALRAEMRGAQESDVVRAEVFGDGWSSSHAEYRAASREHDNYVTIVSTNPATLHRCYDAFKTLPRGESGTEDRDGRLTIFLKDGRRVDLSVAEFRIRSEFGPKIEGCFYDVIDTGNLKPPPSQAGTDAP